MRKRSESFYAKNDYEIEQIYNKRRNLYVRRKSRLNSINNSLNNSKQLINFNAYDDIEIDELGVNSTFQITTIDDSSEDEKEEENNLKADPADINKKETDEIDDAGMKIEKRKNSLEEKKEEKIPKTERTINQEPKYKKIEKKEKIEEKKVNNEDNIKINAVNTLTINQIGELSNYPDALEIDGMECVCE
jgi:hypothetical protein